VLHFATIKPLDEAALLALANKYTTIVTIEEHQRAGGLGSAVTEYLSLVKPTRIVRLGIDDQFGQSGEPTELLTHYELDTPAIVAAVKKALSLT
jgi:transketolase